MAKPIGRPSIYSAELERKIIDRMAEGESIRHICLDADMPARSTVMQWMANDDGFRTRCADARIEQADLMDEMILDVANASTPESSPADRVKISAYQWRAEKLQPKKYGAKLDVTGTVKHELPTMAEVLAKMKELDDEL